MSRTFASAGSSDAEDPAGNSGSGRPAERKRTRSKLSRMTTALSLFSAESLVAFLTLKRTVGNSIGSSERYSSAPVPWKKTPTTSSPAFTRAALPDLHSRVRCPEVRRRSETAEEASSTRSVSNRSIVSASFGSGAAADAVEAAASASAARRTLSLEDGTWIDYTRHRRSQAYNFRATHG